MIALCQIRQQPHYRREAFEAGLRRAGYSLVSSGMPGCREDLLVIWNRYGAFAAMADAWERAGGTVLVCENGYLGRDEDDRQHYAIGGHGHNGNGWFPIGEEDRFSRLGFKPQLWHDEGDYLIVRGQRGIGPAGVASPPNWHDEMARVLRKTQPLPVKVIPHPGNVDPKPDNAEVLSRAAACIIWSSAMGIESLLAGVPVFYAAPHWIAEEAAVHLSGEVLGVAKRDNTSRLAALRKMAWGQWSVAEIESGEPFIRIKKQLQQEVGQPA